jgi:hypothetical protein
MNLSDQPNNTWADEVNQTQSTPDTNISTSSQDIRDDQPINEHEKIIEWCNKIDLIERNAEGIVNFYIRPIKRQNRSCKPTSRSHFYKIQIQGQRILQVLHLL